MSERLRVDRYGSAAEFLAAAGPWLGEREAEHNLILGIASTLREHREVYPQPAYLATVSHDHVLLGATLRTPPSSLVLSEVDDERALDALVADLEADGVPGVVGTPDVATGFANRWVATHGGRWEIAMEERIFKLTTVIPPRPVSGAPCRLSR